VPHSSSIELRTVDRLTPFTSQLGRSALLALLRDGNTVEARVVATPAKDVAQLEIRGQTIDVRTPQALKAGTTISVAINRTGSNLELIIRPDAQGARPMQAAATIAETAGGSQSPEVSIGDRILAAMAAIHKAALGGEAKSENATPASATQAANVPAGSAPQAQLQAEIRARYGLEMTLPEVEAGRAQGLGALSSAQGAAHVAKQPAVSSSLSGQPASAMLAPFQLQQMPHPILVHVEEDDDGDAEPGSRSPAVKRWTAHFSLDTGTIGPVQVSIGLCANALSVRLSSGEPQSAYLLSARLLELKATLEEADFAVEELSVHDSARPGAAPALL
jgi:hypothetical protein